MTTFWFLMRYGIVGLIGGILQICTLYAWVRVLRLEEHYLWGASIGFCIALLVTFTLQKYWTFEDHTHSEAPRQFVSYATIALLCLGLNAFFLHTSKVVIEARGLDFFQIWYLVAQVVSIGITSLLSFIANYFFTFRSRT